MWIGVLELRMVCLLEEILRRSSNYYVMASFTATIKAFVSRFTDLI